MIFKKLGALFFVPFFFAVQTAQADSPTAGAAAGMTFVPIKGGCFQMGDSVGDGDPNERPVHEVCLSSFSIGRYEVTNAQYRQFKPKHNSGSAQGNTLNDDKQPVVNVSWDDAVAYAKWLSQQTGQTYRLPTEAEWEYAARAGSNQSRFWGNSLDDACKYANVGDQTAKKLWPTWTAFPCNDGYAVSAPVGSFAPNGYGLYDMLGNVWEWCEDVYNSEAYSKLPKDNPVYQGMGEYRVIRGGGWSNGPMGVRSSNRVRLFPDFSHHSLGFRLVKVGP